MWKWVNDSKAANVISMKRQTEYRNSNRTRLTEIIAPNLSITSFQNEFIQTLSIFIQIKCFISLLLEKITVRVTGGTSYFAFVLFSPQTHIKCCFDWYECVPALRMSGAMNAFTASRVSLCDQRNGYNFHRTWHYIVRLANPLCSHCSKYR